MKISVDPEVKKKLPQLRLGVIRLTGCEIGPSTPELAKRMKIFVEQLQAEYTLEDVSDLTEIRYWRESFKRLGLSPSRYRPSAEALLRRILKEQDLPAVNSAVEMNNYFSLKYLLPFGIYDFSAITGPIRLYIGGNEDHYMGLNGRKNLMEGHLLLRDDTGPFGSPYVDASRTCVTEKTSDILQVVFSVYEQEDDLAELLTAVSHGFSIINGGRTEEIQIL
ncbi:hypothetical protein GXN76_04930 [Kroppenstedtia pulmonis]|uniref:B3/B4 tRNA-binding domain-containing protein n=1 Tax=Kroppenstedtia pulmonis TaxID=1380685 RepID=A0A7D3Y0U5_9BACL|nr:phenylalanine--tRNA ligase beta subunit-related protein [Kroppenstedtia pulmonis]QKG83883.1 hypothetical protein GXN76_04930 [Kroppenstedtia pulmonis]